MVGCSVSTCASIGSCVSFFPSSPFSYLSGITLNGAGTVRDNGLPTHRLVRRICTVSENEWGRNAATLFTEMWSNIVFKLSILSIQVNRRNIYIINNSFQTED